ncbi:MAG: 16S rRNA (guanine(527)-N(7))-methyltransferase RsmG [Clostridiales bacterium]|nr:16S rRNA (guanine(527)-N(7))-methyltransferase RsmG [Clostridiales bacterium]
MISYNQRYNLTAITEEKEVIYKHFLDSLAGESLFPKGAKVAEIGSGAGFPSIPLKIYRDDLQFTLFESTGKKCEFLKTAVRELGLNNVTVENMRAEDGAKGKYREQFDVSCARAVARMNTLTEYCLPFVRVGGKMIAYKGNEEEVEEARNAVKLLGGAIEGCYSYELPENYGSRVLAVVNKIKETPAKYPRGNGKERSKPIL